MPIPPAVRRPIWIEGPDGWRELRWASAGELIFVGPEDPLAGTQPIPLRLASAHPVPAKLQVELRDRLIRIDGVVRGVDLSAMRPGEALALLAAHGRTVETILWRRPRFDPRVVRAIARLPARELTVWLDRPRLPVPPASVRPLFGRVTALILRGAGALVDLRLLEQFTRLEVLIVEGFVFPGAAIPASTLRRLRQLRAGADALGLAPPAGAGMPGFPEPKKLPTLPPLPGMRHLWLRCSNRAGERLARQWPAVRHLESLVLDGCQLSDNVLIGLSRIPKLAKLATVSRSPGKGPSRTGLRTIGRMASLEELKVEGESVTDRGVGELAGLRRLRRLRLGGKLSEASVLHLAPLTHLEDVALSFAMGQRGLAVVVGWSRLRRLGIYVQAGTSLAPLARLRQLRSLALDHDEKPGAPSGVGGLPVLPRLASLSVRGEVGRRELAAIARQRGLVSLMLVGEEMPRSGLRPLAALPALERLELLVPKLAPGSGLGELTRLRWLSLSPDGATPAPGRKQATFALERLTELRYLSIRFCARALKGLARLTHLETLRISDVPVATMPELYAALPALGKLRALELGNTVTDDAGLRHLGGLRELRYLGLHQTRVTARGLLRLVGLRKLEAVDLVMSGITRAGVEAFQRRHGAAAVLLSAWD